MAIITDQPYHHGESVGMAVVVACGMLSSISVLGMFVILGMSVARSRRSADETLFVLTHAAKFFLALLMCNFAQAIGALFGIAWIVEQRVYVGGICTAQAAFKQIGSVGTAIFTFVIAVHTFSLLFLRRKWTDWACYMTLITSCTILALDLCIGNFVGANVDKKGPYYGITSYWCWITPAYSTEQYTSEYIFLFVSAGFSFILYLLVFFRLRGNITISAGYKVDFHRRPNVRIGRTEAGTYIVTDDRHVESHLTTVAKQMLWHPIAYIVLILPFAAARVSTFSGISVPPTVAIFTSAVFVLTGFVNTVLFCTTRNVLPGNWRQRFGIENLLATRGGDAGLSTWGNSIRRPPESGARMGAPGRTSIVLNTSVEKEVETKQSEGDPSPSSIKLRTPTSLISPIQAYGGKQQADNNSFHFPNASFLPPLDELDSEHTAVRRL